MLSGIHGATADAVLYAVEQGWLQAWCRRSWGIARAPSLPAELSQ